MQEPGRTGSVLADISFNGGLLALLWFAYSAVRSVAGETMAVARSNARWLELFQDRIGIGFEADLQNAIGVPAAFVAANAYYLVHFPITLLVLAVTFRRDRSWLFRKLRNKLIAVTGLALTIHLAYPMAPPRMFPGYIDAGAEFGPDPYSIPGSDGANQLAAMPSMHVAWAILVGWAIWTLTTHRGLRVFAFSHPFITCVVVVVTGHHFVTDVAIGGLLAAVTLFIQSQRSRSVGTVGSSAVERRRTLMALQR